MRASSRARRAATSARGRGEPEAAAHRLDRPLPAAPARSADADRGDAARARRSRAGRARCATSAAPISPRSRSTKRSDIAKRTASRAFVSCQDEYSLLARDIERELVPAAKALGMGVLPVFPARERPAHRQIQARRAAAAGRAARKELPRHAADFITEHNWRIVEAARRLRRAPRPHPDRAGVRLAPARSGRGERDRRRDHPGADRAEHRGCRLESLAGGLGEVDRITL